MCNMIKRITLFSSIPVFAIACGPHLQLLALLSAGDGYTYLAYVCNVVRISDRVFYRR